jgi:type VI secretion system ImpM family protein
MSSGTFPVGCFGKLPFWPEYLELGTGFPTSQSLKQWLHQGREEAGLSGEGLGRTDVELHANLRLLVGVPGSTELLVGVLRPNKDAGGRYFPFVTFTHIPRRQYGRHYALLPLALAPVWRELEEAWDSLASMASKDAFREVLDELKVRAPDALRQVQTDYRSRESETADRLFDRDDGASLDRLNENMPEVLDELKKRGADGGLRVQLPVSGEIDEACLDVSIWIDVLNRQFRFRRYDPSVILDATRGERARLAFLKFGALDPGDYGWTVMPEATMTDFCSPAHPTDPEAGGGAPAGPTGLTMADFLGSRFARRK